MVELLKICVVVFVFVGVASFHKSKVGCGYNDYVVIIGVKKS